MTTQLQRRQRRLRRERKQALVAQRCGCGREVLGPVCLCVPIHEPRPFARMDRSRCDLHRSMT